MASLKNARSQNKEGLFFVDNTCINCGACYWIDPETFKEDAGKSYVFHQPKDNIDNAFHALFSCPVNSIGIREKHPASERVRDSFPILIENEIFHTGFFSENSFGAASYFIQNKIGNILIDSPRYIKKLSLKLKEMGGIQKHLLTHRDDIADTDLYWKDFKGKRFIHKDDTNSKTAKYEVLFDSYDVVQITDDLIMIPVPGHTLGSVCYLYQNKYLFTGDHLAFSKQLGHLYAFKTACWYDFETQINSMERLLEFDFEYVLPGHSAPFKASKIKMKESLTKCIQWMKN